MVDAYFEVFLVNILEEFVEAVDVFIFRQFIAVNAVAFVDP